MGACRIEPVGTGGGENADIAASLSSCRVKYVVKHSPGL